MSISVNTNMSAIVALQNLSQSETELQQAQNTISTGLSVSSAKDNAAVYAIAQGQRADVSALGAVTDSLNRASSITDVALSAGQQISDLLNQMRQKVVAATDTSLSTSSLQALNTDFQSLIKNIQDITNNASFDGANLLNASVTNIQFLANADSTTTLTVAAQDMSFNGVNITIPATADILTNANATTVLTQIDASINNVNQALGSLGAQSNMIATHTTFISKLSDSLNSGIGDLVDANMAAESARLQALQVKQQLGAQSLNIANQAPNVILSLFR